MKSIMGNSQNKKFVGSDQRRPQQRFSSHALSLLARKFYPMHKAVKNIPRDVNVRVHLTMLQWFLHQELPQKFPQIFSPTLVLEPLPHQGWSYSLVIHWCRPAFLRLRGTISRGLSMYSSLCANVECLEVRRCMICAFALSGAYRSQRAP